MYKIAISGKANSGKDTVAQLIRSSYGYIKKNDVQLVALADPIKEMILLMFPRTSRELLYGPSKNRAQIIPGAYKCGEPLTYRKLLQDLGTEVGRGYKQDVWLDALDYKAEQAEEKGIGLFIVTDVRFRNEFDHFKNKNYTMIRVVRDCQLSMTHASEIEQESILDDEFNIIIKNDKSLDDLGCVVGNIVSTLVSE